MVSAVAAALAVTAAVLVLGAVLVGGAEKRMVSDYILCLHAQ